MIVSHGNGGPGAMDRPGAGSGGPCRQTAAPRAGGDKARWKCPGLGAGLARRSIVVLRQGTLGLVGVVSPSRLGSLRGAGSAV